MANWVSCKIWVDASDEATAAEFWSFARSCGYRFDKFTYADDSVYAHWYSKFTPSFHSIVTFAQLHPSICITGRWWVEGILNAGVTQWCDGSLYHNGECSGHLDYGALDPRPWPNAAVPLR